MTSLEQRKRIFELHLQGKKVPAIAKELGLKKDVVHKWIARLKKGAVTIRKWDAPK